MERAQVEKVAGELTLTPEEAKSFYDRFGRKQDGQAFYEAPALHALVANAAFEKAQSVFELGCGTGRFALELLKSHLPGSASYRGIDISTTMVRLASERLASFGPRALVELAKGGGTLPTMGASVDRVVATYVLDLLSDAAAREIVGEALRVLQPDGRLCLTGITHGTTPVSKIVMTAWEWLFERKPSWVGGCRPSELLKYLPPSTWKIRFHGVVVAWGVPSEVVVASPLDSTGPAL